MTLLFPEIFLSISSLILLITGSILSFSSKYNSPIISYKSFTFLILFWTFILLHFQSGFFTNYFLTDCLSIFSKAFIVIVLFLCINIENTDFKKTFEYYVLVLISLLGLFLVSSSNDLLSVYLSLELTTFSFYILSLYYKTSSFSVEAGLKYFVLGALSSSLFIFGISLVYGATGTTNFNNFFLLEFKTYDPFATQIIEFSFIIFSFGLLFKLGCVPFHVWVADVYEGTPTFVTVIFSTLPKISIFSLFVRIIITTELDFWLYFLVTVSFLSIFIGSFHALKQTKTKRLLAFSGVSHVGFALLGVAAGTLKGLSAAILYIIIYTCTAGFMWGVALCVDTSNGRTLYLTDHIQWIRYNPALGLITVLVIFSLAGIPPLAGFFAKFYIFVACIELTLYSVAVIGLLISIIGTLYYLRLIKILSFEEGDYWKRTLKLKKSHVLSIGIFSFFLILFPLYESLINDLATIIVLKYDVEELRKPEITETLIRLLKTLRKIQEEADAELLQFKRNYKLVK